MRRVAEIVDAAASKNFKNPSRDASHKDEQVSLRDLPLIPSLELGKGSQRKGEKGIDLIKIQ